MRIVVIGGTGNISTSIVRRLLHMGHEVTVFNRGQRHTPAGARSLVGDRYNYPEFEATMQRENFDVAIDMICFSRPDAESAVRAFPNVKQFIHTSTVVTYGIRYHWMPVTEDHPLNPISAYAKHKAEADAVYLAAYYHQGFPVTILKPSTTHGPQQGLFRQIANDYIWIDRVRKGKPILVCGNGDAMHQFLHVDDAALAYAGVVGRERCIGQVYNLVDQGYVTWESYHQMLMRIFEQEVPLVGVPLEDLVALDVPNIGICKDIFAHNSYFSSEKLMRDVPEFQPQRTLESAMRDILTVMEFENRIPDSDRPEYAWEDRIIAAQRQVRQSAVSV
ncbi:MAG: SDR family oxidoreductase [Anaerolineae bacterium]